MIDLKTLLGAIKFDVANRNILGIISVVFLPFILLFISIQCLKYDAGYVLLNTASKQTVLSTLDSFKVEVNKFPGKPLYKLDQYEDFNEERCLKVKILNSYESEHTDVYYFAAFYMICFMYVAFVSVTLFSLLTDEIKDKTTTKGMANSVPAFSWILIFIFIGIHYQFLHYAIPFLKF